MNTRFLKLARNAIRNVGLQKALDQNATQRQKARLEALASLPDAHGLRQQARFIRRQTLEYLEGYLEQFEHKLTSNGFQVHRAANIEEAQRIVIRIASRHNAQQIAKAKSMLSEELHLNSALVAAGIQPIETDLGEFIVQLRNEQPSHIITPAMHLLRQDVGKTFADNLHTPYTEDVSELTAIAREKLRQVFYEAPIGLSGVNFGVAETGTLCIVTNEGNGRMVTTLPPVHIALMGVERLVPKFEDLAVMLKLLPRSATGQKLTSYVNLIQGPRHDGDPEGPQERHLILVDNGRLAMNHTPLAEALMCIRCGACLNACPVYREVGGHTYESIYSGPIGSILSPGLFGEKSFGHLAKASTLCGACTDACPVGIEFPTLLLRVRDRYVRSGADQGSTRSFMNIYTWLCESPTRYRWAQRLAALAGRLMPHHNSWLRSLPPPFSNWSHSRDFPPFAKKPFRERVRKMAVQGVARPDVEPPIETFPLPEAETIQDPVLAFRKNLEQVGGEFYQVSEAQAPNQVAELLRRLGIKQLLAWGELEPTIYSILHRLEWEGLKIQQPELPQGVGPERASTLAELDRFEAGLTGASAAIAESGTLVLPGGRRRSQLVSLLPPIHLAILHQRDIYTTMETWMKAGGERQVTNLAQTNLISGPSRTADIEMTLTVGVHGPRRVIVFCLE